MINLSLQILLDDFRRDPNFLWVDDVFITGILAKRAGIKHKSISPAYALSSHFLENERRKEKVIFAHLSGARNHGYRRELWAEFLARNGYALDAESGKLGVVEVRKKVETVTSGVKKPESKRRTARKKRKGNGKNSEAPKEA